MGTEEMKKFVRLCKAHYEGAMPTTGDGLATLLIKKYLPDSTEDHVNKFLELRHQQHHCRHATVVDKDNVDQLDGLLSECLEKEAEETIKAPGAGKGKQQAHSTDGGAGAGSSAAAPSAGQQSARRALPANMTTREAVQECLPEAKGCTVSIHTGKAWQVKYSLKKDPPRSHLATWDASDPDGPQKCAVECIRWAWGAHTELNPDVDCPWDLT